MAGESKLVYAVTMDFSERFYFTYLVFGIAINLSAVIYPNTQRISVGQRISEERHPGKWYLRTTLCCALKQDRMVKRDWRLAGNLKEDGLLVW